jgi:hypothetical protein
MKINVNFYMPKKIANLKIIITKIKNLEALKIYINLLAFDTSIKNCNV